jgi:hypothetical protein
MKSELFPKEYFSSKQLDTGFKICIHHNTDEFDSLNS